MRENGEITVSRWGLWGQLISVEKVGNDSIRFDGPVIVEGNGKLSIQTLPRVSGRAGLAMVRRKISEFAGTNKLTVATMISKSETESTFQFAKLDDAIFNFDVRWSVLTLAGLALLMGIENKILLMGLHGVRRLTVFDERGNITGYRQCADDEEINRVIQSWSGRGLGTGSITTVNCDWRGSREITLNEIADKIGLDKGLVASNPELIFCHPKILRSAPNLATDEMRREVIERRWAALFYGAAWLVASACLWMAREVYRDGLQTQENIFKVESETQKISAKLESSTKITEKKSGLFEVSD